jgi:hypothetical protein
MKHGICKVIAVEIAGSHRLPVLAGATLARFHNTLHV